MSGNPEKAPQSEQEEDFGLDIDWWLKEGDIIDEVDRFLRLEKKEGAAFSSHDEAEILLAGKYGNLHKAPIDSSDFIKIARRRQEEIEQD